ncbi:MAG: hypothetical protein WC030_03495 [Candidatus Paceibacterota bacterium]
MKTKDKVLPQSLRGHLLGILHLHAVAVVYAPTAIVTMGSVGLSSSIHGWILLGAIAAVAAVPACRALREVVRADVGLDFDEERA